MIEKGDSLWSIAQQYMGSEDSVYEYMDELAEANHLSMKDRNNLQEGDYLVVSYYGEEADLLKTTCAVRQQRKSV